MLPGLDRQVYNLFRALGLGQYGPDQNLPFAAIPARKIEPEAPAHLLAWFRLSKTASPIPIWSGAVAARTSATNAQATGPLNRYRRTRSRLELAKSHAPKPVDAMPAWIERC